ncbi:MAG TPA: response regulator transcription factor [Gaiellales bacterium]|jgi:DNA-binding NarL/FixJ family response regulator|nr:response regulator transcription factor [Gaiellales bacterium]
MPARLSLLCCAVLSISLTAAPLGLPEERSRSARPRKHAADEPIPACLPPVVHIIGRLQAVEEALEVHLAREHGMSAKRVTASDLSEYRADVVVIVVKDLHDTGLLSYVRRACPQTPPVMLAAEISPSTYGRAFDLGAAGILDLSLDLDSIAAGIRKASNGEPVRDRAYTLKMLLEGSQEQLRHLELLRTAEQLTVREREILQALADGLTGPEIARHLIISPNTVRNHIANVLTKLGVRSQLQAVLLAGAAGLVRMPEAAPERQRVQVTPRARSSATA